MPIETFTVFVAEQAVGIAVGVVAVAVAPKIVPGLARAATNVKQRGAELALDSASGLAVVAAPVRAAGETAYAQVAGGLHWYGVQWDSLVTDAQAMTASPALEPGQNVATVIASAPAITDLPGRLRLGVKLLRGNGELADGVTTALNALPGITRVRSSSASGNVLVLYAVAQYASAESLRQSIAALQIEHPMDAR